MIDLIGSIFVGLQKVLGSQSVFGINLWHLFLGFLIANVFIVAIIILFKMRGK